MELKDVESCCCVVQVSGGFSAKKPISCSGVIVCPQTGSIICTGLPFSRFIADREPLCSGAGVLFPRSFSSELKIRVSSPAPAHPDFEPSWREKACTAPGSRSHRRERREVPAQLLMLVNCVEFKRAFLGVFKEADQWRFHGDDDGDDDDDDELLRDAQFLSWFAVLRADVFPDSRAASGTVPWQSSSTLHKGCPVVACGSAFGSLCLDLFISTLSGGIISNLAGEDNAVILTDARCLPGTEGGGLFAVEGAEGVHLIGLIVSPFGWKANEWIGLTLVCSVHCIFRSIIRCTGDHNPLGDAWLRSGEADLHMCRTAQVSRAAEYPTVCLVDSGKVWGSGVVVTTKLVVTCRHVVDGRSLVTLKFHHRGRVRHMFGDVLFSTKPSSPYDLAFVELKVPVPDAVVPRTSPSFPPGEAVVVVGYGGLGRTCGPSLTCGVLSKAISLNQRPVMLQTTCAVQAGASGGAVLRRHSGELLGIVSSNTRDLAARVTYPHLNFVIPVTVFQGLLQEFHRSRDIEVFRGLNATGPEIRRVWRLQGAQSKL
ncbi:peroxisomal leader peptide-processing protease [Austrofundulus limnaeus]|uniref:Peroxisomal leader peptide-processing protease n=1 Tax=Austrofundulus limnaeus TaxID=52670 RepID=A0A2I4AYI5_AUSLI|nr:PREDICTED: peroxisomal leader peptide-processing protease [Austrofundulus limnaeus]